MKNMRLTKAAWLLLQRLNQADAQLAFCTDRRCSRYHFSLRGSVGDIVRDSTLDALDSSGLLMRSRTAVPTYEINEKGRQLLRERMTDLEFAEETHGNLTDSSTLSVTK